MTLLLTYPPECDDNDKKYAYTYVLQELLRRRHNQVGTDYREGRMTKVQWNDFLNTWYDPRSNTVIHDLSELRQAIKDSAGDFTVDLDGIID